MGVQLRGDIQRVEEQSPFSAGLRRCRPGPWPVSSWHGCWGVW